MSAFRSASSTAVNAHAAIGDAAGKAAIATTICLLAASCAGESARETSKEIGAGVRMTSKSLPEMARAKEAPRIKAPYANITPVSATYRIAPAGKLPAPATLRIPLKRRLPPGVPVMAARAQKPGEPWTPVRVRLSSNRRYAFVRVGHLSLFSVFTTGVGDLLRELKEGVLDGVTAGLTAEAKPPDCDGEDEARFEGHSVASDSKDTVYWCFGLENGSRILRIVNNRRYPLALTHAGLPVTQQGGGGVRWERLSRFISGEEAIVSPREQLSFSVRLNPGGSAGIRTRFDGVGFSLYQLQFGVESLIEILTRFGAGSGVTSVDVIDKLLMIPNCASAIGGTAGDLISKCFSKSQLADVLGPKGYLVAPLMATSELLSFFRSAFNAAGDQLNGRDVYRIVIRREASSQPPTVPSPTPPTQEPPATVPTSGFEVGDDFDLQCQVAWPTAPYRTSNSIQMMMQCVGLPREFLLVQVTYPDPNFPISPSTGRVRVRGKIADIARSELGFRILVVIADEIGQ